MKITIQKFFLTLFLLIEIGSVVAFSNTTVNNTVLSSKSNLNVKVDISFVIARRRDCEGLGICKLHLGLTNEKVINACAGSLSSDVLNRNALILEINKTSGINSAAYDKYFSSGIFIIEDDAPVPSDVTQQLGIGNKTIVAGKYVIKEANGILYISLTVK